MSMFISKETAHRLLKDVKNIIKSPLSDQGIYYIHDDTNMMKGYAMIIGPSETPYFGGFYFFEFHYPRDYPHSPPKVEYCTNNGQTRFNPNLYVNGKVCVSLLNTWSGDQWTSCQTISTVLLTLCTLLCDKPLLNEPGVLLKHPDINTYTDIIEFANLDTAVCDIVNKNPNVYKPFFDYFYPYIKENFNKTYDQLLEFAENRLANKFKHRTLVSTSFYQLNTVIDYQYIVDKLKETKKSLD